MLSVQEALLLKAAQEETEKQEAINNAALAGAVGGAGIGVVGGQVPHLIGKGINAVAGRKPNRLKPGPRMAGGLTGLILGGGLGAGMAAIMKRDSEAGRILGKIQAQGGKLDSIDEANLSRILGEMYQNPSQLM